MLTREVVAELFAFYWNHDGSMQMQPRPGHCSGKNGFDVVFIGITFNHEKPQNENQKVSGIYSGPMLFVQKLSFFLLLIAVLCEEKFIYFQDQWVVFVDPLRRRLLTCLFSIFNVRYLFLAYWHCGNICNDIFILQIMKSVWGNEFGYDCIAQKCIQIAMGIEEPSNV